ncbi:hypothetical protein DW352_24435 [Pseudolabrys taiwanensis]|uniref:Secreted protein n=1 Tax=Pseudolabrys taiwanensis TaxID=331696 RepID=A0A346A2J5_9HYPH|nr:hypothetical protein [Pseudolabrys taiwanensis]AXK83392.1 hypothetical protein DW352_24435 [Pseudolabrys taiwanensis]
MKVRWLIVAVAALGVVAANAAVAKPRKAKTPPRAAACVDGPYQFSWDFLLPGNHGPQPNGCAPPVYQYGRYIGQDPDPNIRFQLMRDPATGYSGEFSR